MASRPPSPVHQLTLLDSHTVLRGDIARLQRCTAITTGGDLSSPSSIEPDSDDDDTEGKSLESVLPRTIKRSKPFKYAYEKEIVMYAYFKVRLLFHLLLRFLLCGCGAD
jgi:hypothetical protein